jgi:hypothetical protein
MSARFAYRASLGFCLIGAALIPACGSDSKNFSEVPSAGTGGSGVSGGAGMLGKGGSSGSSSGKGGSSGSAGKGGGAGQGGQGGASGAGAAAGEDSMGGAPAEGGAPSDGGTPGTSGSAGEGTGATGGAPTIDECVEDVLGEGCRALLDCATEACDLAPCVGEGYSEGDYSGGACESFINCPLECDCDETCVNNTCTPETAGDCMTCLVPQYLCIQAACPDEIAGCDLLSP